MHSWQSTRTCLLVKIAESTRIQTMKAIVESFRALLCLGLFAAAARHMQTNLAVRGAETKPQLLK